jgi:glycosyltransferase involved in cell wall biosynthesis
MQISVIIPTYNRYELLKRALTSVYAQTFQPAEVIVVDDGSSDATYNIKNDFPNIIYIRQENKGVSNARNVGIKQASCQWMAFLDSDDEFHADKLQKQVDFHTKNPNIFMSYTDEIWVHDGVQRKIPKKFQKIGKDVFLENLSYCNIAPSSVMLHKKVLKKVGLFDEEMEICEDYDLWLRIAIEFDIALISKKLIKKYAGHEDQLSFKHWGMDRFRVRSLEKLLEIIDASSFKKEAFIIKELMQKYELLLKGAIKHDKTVEIALYEKKLTFLNKRYVTIQ